MDNEAGGGKPPVNTHSTCFLYKATRNNLEAQPFLSTLEIEVDQDSSELSYAAKHPDISDTIESLFEQKGLSSDGGVFTRLSRHLPASLSWRVHNNRKALSVEPADFASPVESTTSKSALCIQLRFKFAAPIRQTCVGFVDSADSDQIVLHVLTEASVLHSIILHSAAFHTKFAAESLVDSTVSRPFPIANLRFRNALALKPVSIGDLILPLDDGSLLRLSRVSHDWHGGYKEVIIREGGVWSSMKRMLDVRGTGSHANAIISSTTLNVSEADVDLFFGVTRNQLLKVYNSQTMELLAVHSLAQNIAPDGSGALLQDAPANLVSALATPKHPLYAFIAITFVESHFKFWGAIRGVDGESFGSLVDLYPAQLFPATYMQENPEWQMGHFAVAQQIDAHDPEAYNMWVLWRNGIFLTCQVMSFDLAALAQDSSKQWTQWISVSDELLHNVGEFRISFDNSEDQIDFNMDRIMYPRRYAEIVLENALTVFQDSNNVSLTSPPETMSLRARIASSIGQNIVLEPLNQESDVSTKYRGEIEQQWLGFIAMCETMENKRQLPLALNVDSQNGAVWISTAGGLTTVRVSKPSEILLAHAMLEGNFSFDLLRKRINCGKEFQPSADQLRDLMFLVSAAHRLMVYRPNDCYDAFLRQLHESAFGGDSLPDYGIAQHLKSLWTETDTLDEDAQKVSNQAAMDPLKKISDLETAYAYLIKALELSNNGKSEAAVRLTAIGSSEVVKCAQEVALVEKTLAAEAILLLAYLASQASEMLEVLDVTRIYKKLLEPFKDAVVLDWMATSFISELQSVQSRKSMDFSNAPQEGEARWSSGHFPDKMQSVLQWKILNNPMLDVSHQADISPMRLLTRNTSAIVDHMRGSGPDSYFLYKVAAQLLENNSVPLANEFKQFLPRGSAQTQWLRGMILLRQSNFVDAASCFRLVANTISDVTNASIRDFAEAVLPPHERGNFTAGHPKYFHFIAECFEKYHAYQEALEFNKFANEAIMEMRTLDADHENLRTDVAMRIFECALRVSDFKEAHNAILALTNKVIQGNFIRKLVTALIDTRRPGELLNFKFPELEGLVDEQLYRLCKEAAHPDAASDYQKLLYCWRLKHENFRGAASILHERALAIEAIGPDGEDFSEIEDANVLVLNALSLADDSQAWLLESSKTGKYDEPAKKAKLDQEAETGKTRRLLRLDQLQDKYLQELENKRSLLAGNFYL